MKMEYSGGRKDMYIRRKNIIISLLYDKYENKVAAACKYVSMFVFVVGIVVVSMVSVRVA